MKHFNLNPNSFFMAIRIILIVQYPIIAYSQIDINDISIISEYDILIGSDIDSSSYTSATGLNLTLGRYAGNSMTTAISNSFIGYGAGKNTTIGNHNVFIGAGAGSENEDGSFNMFVGRNSGYFNKSGNQNVAFGYGSFQQPVAGFGNSVIGVGALKFSNEVTYNTFIGHKAGENFTNGHYNVVIGAGAGNNIDLGNRNVFIGYEAGTNMNGDNQLVIANGQDISNRIIWGNFETGFIKIKGGLKIGEFSSNEPGAIRFSNGQFEGFNGNEWIPFSSSNPSGINVASLWVPGPSSGRLGTWDDYTTTPCQDVCPPGYIAGADANGYTCRTKDNEYGTQVMSSWAFKEEWINSLKKIEYYEASFTIIGGQLSIPKTLAQCHCLKLDGAIGGGGGFVNDSNVNGDPLLERDATKLFSEAKSIKNEISISPNPSDTKFNVTLTEELLSNGNLNVVVLNRQGQKVFFDAINHSSFQLNLANQPKGAYSVIFENGKEYIVKQIHIN